MAVVSQDQSMGNDSHVVTPTHHTSHTLSDHNHRYERSDGSSAIFTSSRGRDRDRHVLAKCQCQCLRLKNYARSIFCGDRTSSSPSWVAVRLSCTLNRRSCLVLYGYARTAWHREEGRYEYITMSLSVLEDTANAAIVRVMDVTLRSAANVPTTI